MLNYQQKTSTLENLTSFPRIRLLELWQLKLTGGLTGNLMCNPTWTSKSLQKQPFTPNQLWAFLYTDCLNLTNHSSTPIFLTVRQMISLVNWSKALFKSKNSKSNTFWPCITLVTSQDANGICTASHFYQPAVFFISRKLSRLFSQCNLVILSPCTFLSKASFFHYNNWKPN